MNSEFLKNLNHMLTRSSTGTLRFSRYNNGRERYVFFNFYL